MTVAQQLHDNATHAKGLRDTSCPICNPMRTKLLGIVRRLEQCARTNQAEPAADAHAHAVANEQWRVARILKALAE